MAGADFALMFLAIPFIIIFAACNYYCRKKEIEHVVSNYDRNQAQQAQTTPQNNQNTLQMIRSAIAQSEIETATTISARNMTAFDACHMPPPLNGKDSTLPTYSEVMEQKLAESRREAANNQNINNR